MFLVEQSLITIRKSKTAAYGRPAMTSMNSCELGAIFTAKYRTKGGRTIGRGITMSSYTEAVKGIVLTDLKEILRMLSLIQVKRTVL